MGDLGGAYAHFNDARDADALADGLFPGGEGAAAEDAVAGADPSRDVYGLGADAADDQRNGPTALRSRPGSTSVLTLP